MKYAQDLLEDAKINPCIPEALDDLSEVCEIFAKTHGVHAEICAEPFFYYGKALLEMSKIESAVLGNCLEGCDLEVVEEKSDVSQVENPEDLSRAEMEEIDEQVWDAFEENFDQHETVAMLHRGEEEFDQDSDSEEEPDETEPEAEGKPDGDEIGHLELAWEMLELAKSICATCGKADMEAEALHYLGEVCVQLQEHLFNDACSFHR